MAAKVNTTIEEGILRVCLEGNVGFEVADFQMMEELSNALEECARNDGAHVLLDLTNVRMYFLSSHMLVFMPLFEIKKRCRVAVVYPEDTHLRKRMDIAYNRVFDCFENESEAKKFLGSHTPMKNAKLLVDWLSTSLGPEVGPECCEREHCDNRRIARSVFCRWHHYRAICASRTQG